MHKFTQYISVLMDSVRPWSIILHERHVRLDNCDPLCENQPYAMGE